MTEKMLLTLVSYAILFAFIQFHIVTCSTNCDHSASCGKLTNISYPFRLKGDPENCGDPNYELSCENSSMVLQLFDGKYKVEAINYKDRTIRVVDLAVQKEKCSTIPLHSLTYFNFSTSSINSYGFVLHKFFIFVSCENSVNSSLYVNRAPCIDQTRYPKKIERYNYVLWGGRDIPYGEKSTDPSDIVDSCRVDLIVPSASKLPCYDNCSYLELHSALAEGFELSWYYIYCKECGNQGPCKYGDGKQVVGCYGECDFQCFKEKFIQAMIYQVPYLLYFILLFIIAPCLGARFLCGITCFGIFLRYKWRRRHLSMYDKIEDFLHSNNNLMPITYTFSDIRKMTKGFKEKLGEGGYGSVYKGKLRSGRDVAVKILGKSNSCGQEFINEVATIGRIHHMNVVQLIGFCAEGSKRALLYEFMPNGSLEKYIFSQGSVSLSIEKMYEISLGVARGIEYLHRGCSMRILHFDIKPHNILLDENFIPKVSDFGLAKLYSTDSYASVTAARGTIGYIAPELFYKNIGAVSCKADVYSFGALLMEMASRRKNFNGTVEKSSQMYFPCWIHEQYSEGKDIELGGATEKDKSIVKKMILVALWCMQMNPTARPSMDEVIKMLEGDIEHLQVAPKSSLFLEDIEGTSESTSSVRLSGQSRQTFSVHIGSE